LVENVRIPSYRREESKIAQKTVIYLNVPGKESGEQNSQLSEANGGLGADRVPRFLRFEEFLNALQACFSSVFT